MFPVFISRIYFEEPYGTELATKRLVMLELTWPDERKSKCCLRRRASPWYQYAVMN